MKTDILLLLESKERELESACLLKRELERRNYNVILKSVYPNKESYIFKYNPRIVITPWVYNENDMKYFSCFYKHGKTKILNLHHEQYSGNNSDNSCLPKEGAKSVYHISWGNEFTEELIKIGCKKEKICQSGNIRLDFFKNKFKKMSKTKEQLAKEFDISVTKKWVLFIANGYHLAGKKQLDNMCTIDKKAKLKAEISIKTRRKFLEYVDKYLSENDDIVFIYRPHPVYSFLDMKQEEIQYLTSKYKGRFVCNFSYAIRNWIVNSDIILSFHSTAGTECYAAQKMYVLFRPIEFDKSLDYEFYYDYPYIIKDYTDFIKFLNDNTKMELKNVYKQYFDIELEEYAYLKICDFVEDILKNNNLKIEKNKANIFNLAYMYTKMLYKKLVRIIYKICPRIFKNIKDTRYSHIIDNPADCVYEEELKYNYAMIDEALYGKEE